MNAAFTVEESNLICIYSSKDRQMALDGLTHALPFTEEDDMKLLICNTIDKLLRISDDKLVVILIKLGLFIAVRVLGLVFKPAVRDIYSASTGMDPVIVVLEIRKKYLLSLKVLRWIEDLFYLFWRHHTKLLYRDFGCLISAHNECQCAGADVIPIHNGSGRTFIKAHLNGAYDCVVVLHGHASFRNHFFDYERNYNTVFDQLKRKCVQIRVETMLSFNRNGCSGQPEYASRSSKAQFNPWTWYS